MISVQGRGRPRREHLSVAPSVASHNSSPPPKSEFSEQPAGPLGAKPPVNVVPATDIPKYSENDLQQILKTVLEARAPTPVSTPAPVISEVPQDKLKARSPDVYRGKFYMDCYNFY